MHVLIVDDSNAMRMIVRRTLRQAGYQPTTISEARNGIEALSFVRNSAPDLILCDWNMPEMSGLELLENLKRIGCPSKFGFVTSESTPEMLAVAMNAGALFLVTKPFTPDSFRTALAPVYVNSH
jgi:two-component system chemotaxis response regulator CheY